MPESDFKIIKKLEEVIEYLDIHGNASLTAKNLSLYCNDELDESLIIDLEDFKFIKNHVRSLKVNFFKNPYTQKIQFTYMDERFHLVFISIPNYNLYGADYDYYYNSKVESVASADHPTICSGDTERLDVLSFNHNIEDYRIITIIN